MLHSQGFLHHLAHHFGGAFEVEAFARAPVQLPGDGIQLLLAMSRQVRALGQVLTDQSVDVFVAAALPRAVRVAEVNGDTGLLGDLGGPCHLPSRVVGHALAHRQRHAVQGSAKAHHCEIAVASCMGAAPYRIGQVLHSVFAAALPISMRRA
ncbi:hypothetical protein D3C77_292890 [compost metagenome]